ncbi:MAG: DEAD/DEAH box helicase, partial [Bacilli bacterium]|nr:DEAD/DEAH box helicase [Bacilli bacterium]
MNKTPELIVVPIKNDVFLDYDYLININESQYKFEENFKSKFNESKGLALFNLGFANKNQKMSLSLKYLYHISRYFLHRLIQIPDLDELKDQVSVQLDDGKADYFIRTSPFITNANFINQSWINKIWNMINIGYQEASQEITGSIQDYLYKKNKSLVNAGRVCFHLVENKLEPTKFAFMTTFQIFDLNSSRIKNISLKKTLEQFNNDQEQLLKILGPITNAAGNSTFINNLLETGEIFYPLTLNKDEAFQFLTEIPLYEQANIICKVPNWWKKKYKTKIGVSIGNKKSYLNFDELADFEINIHLGNLNISIEDLDEILKLNNGLVQYKGEWIEIDKQKLLELQEAYLKVAHELNESDVTLFEALKLELSETKEIKSTDIDIEVTAGEWVQKTLRNIVIQDKLDEISMGDDFYAKLRPYQAKGVNWLNTMKSLRLGCCLADDMGLGKTVQVLGWLNSLKDKNENSLLVIPASLIGNWISETNRFAPNLKYYIYHPNYMSSSAAELTDDEVNSYDLIITTYSMLSKNKLFKEKKWDNIILDEAQAIKNSTTQQSKSARSLKAKYRVALTGTPIENRLSDLWSLFDFLNKGLLGSSKEFKEYVKAMDEDDSYYERLREQIKPFILRRLKTDKSIIDDLPEKLETKVYASLSKKQLALYNDVLESLKEKIAGTAGIGRKGLILQSIIKFKQICNHPSQYLGSEEYLIDDSGKFAVLSDICETIASSRERVLVFTQFREITPYLDDFLYNVFGQRGLVLTGNTQIKKRKELVDLFQSNQYIPYMVITVKAGGVGLNLTNANHVIHFDRWWNPAVENQATDRAFRIGQKKNVIVHKFITKNTVEEKIDAMIMDKVKLSDTLIGDNNEITITNMTNQEIINLFRIEE